MALTHRSSRHIDLPHEPESWIEVRMPSLSILDRAREAKSRRVIGLMAGMDLSQLKNLQSDKQVESTESDYDWQTLLGACITAWSYEDPVTAENIAELDDVTVSVLLAELLPQETEASQKKGSGSSTTPSTDAGLRLVNG